MWGMTAHAVIIGGGIGGLAAAAGLQQAGWEVTVCERDGDADRGNGRGGSRRRGAGCG
jgi:2-polyprenyl-6-methoxyphenol hydroxylase-like FAD-dependent oxidoreductase